MKICMVSAYLPDFHKVWGGAEREAWRIGSLLEKKGEDIIYFTCKFESEKEIPPNIFPTKTVKETIIGRVPYLYDQMSYFGLLPDYIAASNFSELLKKERPDVVHFHNFMPMSLKIVDEAMKLKIPTVLTIYDYKYICIKETLYDDSRGVVCDGKQDRCIECVGHKKMKSLKKLLMAKRKFVFNKVLGNIDCITVLSNNSRELMVNAGFDEGKIKVINLTFDFNEVNKYGSDEYKLDPGLVLFVGWIQPRKGIDIVVEAFKKIADEIPGAKLVVFGAADNEEYENKIKSVVNESNLRDRVEFKGRRPYPEVRDYMTRANAVVIAEQWPNMSPLTMVEAMAYKRGVVAGAIGGIPEFIEHGKTGFLAKYNDPEEFAGYIIKLIKEPELARKLGESASEKVRGIFDGNVVVDKYIELYNSIC
ncbi:MAG: glycosyltransferase family 4 protein [Candidatus Eremiobacteraeota bacterium]|nr:glycosyltransferase family 4 protein [Candidatus Eremiobacteraeota bacterium]